VWAAISNSSRPCLVAGLCPPHLVVALSVILSSGFARNNPGGDGKLKCRGTATILSADIWTAWQTQCESGSLNAHHASSALQSRRGRVALPVLRPESVQSSSWTRESRTISRHRFDDEAWMAVAMRAIARCRKAVGPRRIHGDTEDRFLRVYYAFCRASYMDAASCQAFFDFCFTGINCSHTFGLRVRRVAAGP
jgi:hypothetical protein